MSSKVEVMEKNLLIVHERAFQAAPPELQFLKNHGLANIYLFVTQLCLTHVSSATGAQQAREKLQKAIRLHPQFLLNKQALIFLLKLLLIGVLSPKIAGYILQKLSKARAANKPEAVV
jgi:hypothetical protein